MGTPLSRFASLPMRRQHARRPCASRLKPEYPRPSSGIGTPAPLFPAATARLGEGISAAAARCIGHWERLGFKSALTRPGPGSGPRFLWARVHLRYKSTRGTPVRRGLSPLAWIRTPAVSPPEPHAGVQPSLAPHPPALHGNQACTLLHFPCSLAAPAAQTGSRSVSRGCHLLLRRFSLKCHLLLRRFN